MAEPKGKLVVPVAFRDDASIRALEVNDDDELKVALSTASGSDLLTELETKLETADFELVSKILSIGMHGWISGAWQRQPILMGFSARIRGYNDVTADGAGDYEILTTVVDPGEVHYINFISTYHNDPTDRSIFLYARGDGLNHPIKTFKSVGSGEIQICDSAFALGPGDRIRLKIYSLADTKKMYCFWWGRRIDIDL